MDTVQLVLLLFVVVLPVLSSLLFHGALAFSLIRSVKAEQRK